MISALIQLRKLMLPKCNYFQLANLIPLSPLKLGDNEVEN
jgi:hypothetical protein